MNISQSLAAATSALEEAGVAQPRRQASSLLAFILDRDAAFLIAHPEYELDDEQAAAFGLAVGRRAEREPFQYITGVQEFFDLTFHVEPEVLIPRPETEILVENAIDLLEDRDHPSFLEIGVGSGCISVSLLHALPAASGVATDVSPFAIALAARNAQHHGVGNRLRLIHGSLFADSQDRFDVIVSNPPYIPGVELASLQPEVRDYEPHTALAGGPDGLDLIRQIISGAPGYLMPGGSVVMEIGHGQAGGVENELDPQIWLQPSFKNDLQGIRRAVVVSLRPQPAPLGQ